MVSNDYFDEFLLEDWSNIDKELANDSYFHNDKAQQEKTDQSSMDEQGPTETPEALVQRPTYDRHKSESKKERLDRVREEYNRRPHVFVGAKLQERRRARAAQVEQIDMTVFKKDEQDDQELRKKKIKKQHPEIDDDAIIKLTGDDEDYPEARPSSVSHDSTITYLKPGSLKQQLTAFAKDLLSKGYKKEAAAILRVTSMVK